MIHGQQKHQVMNGDVGIYTTDLQNNENDSHNYYNKRAISHPSLSCS